MNLMITQLYLKIDINFSLNIVNTFVYGDSLLPVNSIQKH